MVLFALLITCTSVAFASNVNDLNLGLEDSDDVIIPADFEDDWDDDSDFEDDSYGEEVNAVTDYYTHDEDFWKCGGSTEVPIPVGKGQIAPIGKDVSSTNGLKPNQVNVRETSIKYEDMINKAYSSANSRDVQSDSSDEKDTVNEIPERSSGSFLTDGQDNHLETQMHNEAGESPSSQANGIGFRSVSKSINLSASNNNESDDGNTSVDINKKADNPENTEGTDYFGVFGFIICSFIYSLGSLI